MTELTIDIHDFFDKCPEPSWINHDRGRVIVTIRTDKSRDMGTGVNCQVSASWLEPYADNYSVLVLKPKGQGDRCSSPCGPLSRWSRRFCSLGSTLFPSASADMQTKTRAAMLHGLAWAACCG